MSEHAQRVGRRLCASVRQHAPCRTFFLARERISFEFRVQPPDLGVQLNETQACGGNEPVCFHSGKTLVAYRLQIDTGRGLLSLRVTIDIREVQARGFHDGAIMAHTRRKSGN